VVLVRRLVFERLVGAVMVITLNPSTSGRQMEGGPALFGIKT
jgi:hypothetical protein